MPYTLDDFVQITAFCLWGSLLAFGTSDGNIVIYHIPNQKRLDNLGLYKPLFIQKVIDDAITYLVINDDNDSPIALVSTENKFVLLKWK